MSQKKNLDIFFRPKVGKRDLFEIVVDGDVWKEVHKSIFGKNPTFPPSSSSVGISALFDALELKRAKAYLLWRLSRCSYHSDQLRLILSERLVSHKTIESSLNYLQSMGVIHDEEWMVQFIAAHKRKYGMRLIRAKLKAKGISEGNLSCVNFVPEKEDRIAEVETLVAWIKKKSLRKDLSDRKEKQKVILSLLRKGYELEQIKSAFLSV